VQVIVVAVQNCQGGSGPPSQNKDGQRYHQQLSHDVATTGSIMIKGAITCSR